MLVRSLLLGAALAALTACSDFPELRTPLTTGRSTAVYPRLRPLPELADRAAPAPGGTSDRLAARAAALRRRAGQLRGRVVVADATATRLSEAIARNRRRAGD